MFATYDQLMYTFWSELIGHFDRKNKNKNIMDNNLINKTKSMVNTEGVFTLLQYL